MNELLIRRKTTVLGDSVCQQKKEQTKYQPFMYQIQQKPLILLANHKRK